MFIILVIILIVLVYGYSFNNRNKDLDYKLSAPYQQLGNDEKLKADIVAGLEITINNEVIKNFSDATLIKKAIKNLIEKRENSLHENINSISKQYKISQKIVKDTIPLACNYVRLKYDVSSQSANSSVKKPKSKEIKTEASFTKSFDLTKKQKLACNIFLYGIIHSSYTARRENPKLYELYNKVEKNQLEFLGISIYETTDYLEWAQKNRSLYIETLRSLNNTQKDYLVFMAMELLWCNGTPDQEEYIKFEKSFDKILLMSKEEFAERIIKIGTLVSKFS